MWSAGRTIPVNLFHTLAPSSRGSSAGLFLFLVSGLEIHRKGKDSCVAPEPMREMTNICDEWLLNAR